ncbi:MAG: hypothetical protein AAF572_25765 [Cyanobacteria bacterium P01_B01_bin.77]
MISLTGLIDDEKCYDVVRQFRWSKGVNCPIVSLSRLQNETIMRNILSVIIIIVRAVSESLMT